jgi:hypothetical protein
VYALSCAHSIEAIGSCAVLPTRPAIINDLLALDLLSLTWTLRRDQISSDLEADAFQRHTAALINDLLTPALLSLAWTSHLLDSFLLYLKQFRVLLFGSGAVVTPSTTSSRARPLQRRL